MYQSMLVASAPAGSTALCKGNANLISRLGDLEVLPHVGDVVNPNELLNVGVPLHNGASLICRTLANRFMKVIITQ